MIRLRSHLTYANTIATVALFVALGGSSYAAFSLPANSVGTKQLKNGAVTASKVRSGSLLSTDFKQGQLPVGPKGDPGRQGSPGSPGYSVTSAALQSGDSNCPNGGSSFTSASGTTYACTGNAVAYAEVSSSGVGINPHILGGYNVISATNPSTGLYCLTLSVHPHVGVASNNGDGGGAVMSVYVPPAGSQCDAYVYSYADASTAGGLFAPHEVSEFNVIFN